MSINVDRNVLQQNNEITSDERLLPLTRHVTLRYQPLLSLEPATRTVTQKNPMYIISNGVTDLKNESDFWILDPNTKIKEPDGFLKREIYSIANCVAHRN